MTETEKNNKSGKDMRSKLIILLMLVYIAATSFRSALYQLTLPYYLKVIGFEMEIATEMANTEANIAAIAFAVAILAIIFGMYLIKTEAKGK